MIRVLVALLLATPLVLFDGAYVAHTANTAGESAAGDQGDVVLNGVTAGRALFVCGELNDDSPTLTVTFDNGDTSGTIENGAFLATAFRDACWPVQNTNGGNITATYDGSENDGDRWNMMLIAELSGLSTTDLVEADNSGINLSVTTTYTSPSVTCAAACFITALFGTNRDPSLTSAGTVPTGGEWTPTGADGFTYLFAYRRESGAGTYTMEITLDTSGAAWVTIFAFNEAVGATFPFGILPNTPLKGGGPRLVVRGRR